MKNSKMLFIYFMFLMIFTTKFNKFIMMLISIELLMFTTIIISLPNLMLFNMEWITIYFLVIMVTESALALAILIMMSRIYNNDFLTMTNMQW